MPGEVRLSDDDLNVAGSKKSTVFRLTSVIRLEPEKVRRGSLSVFSEFSLYKIGT